jgi:hypothetical protein
MKLVSYERRNSVEHKAENVPALKSTVWIFTWMRVRATAEFVKS